MRSWTSRDHQSEIRNPDGTIVFKLDDVEVPAGWSQVASDVIAQKYFRKAGVPASEEASRKRACRSSCGARSPTARMTRLRRRNLGQAGVRPSGRRLGLLGLEGWLFHHRRGRQRLFRRDALHAGQPDGRAQLAAMVQHRPALGLWHRRPGAGPLLCRLQDRQADQVDSAYEHPQPHACFIQSVADDLVGDGGIMDLWVREARLFKYGSGTGTNFSACAPRASRCRAAASRRA